ncbi:MAG: AAA-like domain-containing protein [Acidobacteria bacterium]|nr:AAA-like domain-containing protein [Acidobacteriota bacterium]
MSRPINHYYEFGPFRLDVIEHRLLRDGELVPLTPKLFELLLLLVRNSGHLLEKNELMQAIWSESFVEEGNLSRNISALRKALGGSDGEYIETVPKWGYRFVASVRELPPADVGLIIQECITASLIIDEEEETNGQVETARGDQDVMAQAFASSPVSPFTLAPARAGKLEPVGGAIPLDSQFYIVRPIDKEFQSAIAQQDSIVLVKGARQVGKASLLARGLQQARAGGARVVLTDLQMLNASDLESVETLFLALAEIIANRLNLDVLPRAVWDPLCGPNLNFERYWRRQVLGQISSPVVWGLDEVDRLFSRPFSNEVFGLFRSWHNARSLDPDGPWRQLTLAIAYATEAHLFITDLNQSPFNVGTRLLLDDFTLEQVAELNHRYGSPVQEPEEIERYFRLLGGHPYLSHCGLHEMGVNGLEMTALVAKAASDDGPFGNHLRHMLAALAQDVGLCEIVRDVLRGQPCPNAEGFYRLRSAGVLAGDSAQQVKPRCQLYAAYLERHLL